jgi:murein DD-endopeptidase MepM/ murein hydrolase activator NlpD
MGLKHHTIILVPHARARFRKWRVSNLQIGLAVAAFVALTLALSFVTWSFLTATVDHREIDAVRSENEKLRQVNESFETNIHRLQQQLAEYEERTRKLAIVAGLETLAEADEAGVGGPDLQLEPLTLDALQARASDLSGEIDRVSDRFDEQRRWISATPAIAPVKGILTSGFGSRRDPITGRRESHPAIDIAAAPGKPVHATADGIVTRAGDVGGGLGTAVFVAHGYGLTTRYAHLSNASVTPGQSIRRGDVIGFVGTSGRSTGYHLHYEVLVDGEAVDPLAYILDDPAGAS